MNAEDIKKTLTDIRAEISIKFFGKDTSEQISLPEEIKRFFPDTPMIIVINPNAAFFPPRDPEEIKAEIAEKAKQHEHQKTKSAEKQNQQFRDRSKSKKRDRGLEK